MATLVDQAAPNIEDPIVGPMDGREIAAPLHVQRIEHALRLEPLLSYVDNLLKVPVSFGDVEDSTTDADTDTNQGSDTEAEGVKIINGIVTTKSERRADKTRLYNFSKVKKNRKWLKNALLSDSSSDNDEDAPVPEEQFREMLKFHKYQRMCQAEFYKNRENGQYKYFSSGMLSNYDKFPEHQKTLVGPKKKEQKRLERKMKAKLKKLKKERYGEDGEILPKYKGKHGKQKKLTPEQAAIKRRKIWLSICKKEITKEQKRKANARKEMLGNLKKVAQQCQKEARRAAIQSQKTTKEAVLRARRLSREMLTYWKRFEKVEKEHRKRAEKEAQEQRKMDLGLMEAKRQQRKLNFLISQTELYAHFMARKLTGESDEDRDQILRRLEDEGPGRKQLEVEGGVLMDQLIDDYDSDRMKQLAMKNAHDAYDQHRARTQQFDSTVGLGHKKSSGGFESTVSSDAERPQPSIFEGKLKGYQLKGMNWLANLYNQGINGILADEMGLGKTVQSMAFLAHLAEASNIWGPFLVVAPASTLHNWQQECSRFVPKFKCVPYWGNTQDRKILRKFWNSSNIHSQDASFHVVITSYQLVIQDVKYFQKINWHYMILDEAQALKSSSSIRWKILLGFNCRNRLLLTGTPIQNSMAELWALLHFIMPTLFDSHDEFNEWFSKDIENHAEKQSGIDQDQLSRLHMILKPFMLRRVKKDVENELSDKIEILVYCPLTTRQRLLYQGIKNKISIDDLLQSASASSTSQAQSTTSSLMNLVMQFRKVCNHPELFERRETRSGFFLKTEPFALPKLIFRDGMLDRSLPSLQRILYNTMYIFNPEYIHRTLFPQKSEEKEERSCFSFLRFIDVSPMEMYEQMYAGLYYRWLAVCMWWKTAYTIHHQQEWQLENAQRYMQNKQFILEPISTTSIANIRDSTNLNRLVFTSPTSSVYTHQSHTLKCMPETASHRKIRFRSHSSSSQGSPIKQATSPTKSPHSPTKKHHHVQQQLEQKVDKSEEIVIHKHKPRPPRVLECQPTEMPPLLYYSIPKVFCKTRDYYCPDRSAEWVHIKEQLCGTLEARNTFLYGSPDQALAYRWRGYYFTPVQLGGMNSVQPKHGYSSVYVPDKETLVTDAGKLHLLDTLLGRLKREGHRVLIYSQMTRMIDILEEYMWHRKHTYMRLDGSSKISDRRDMVADFQTRSDIFVFLLSTRAGGLGINLTAADTVIFYDSDWNPTVDQQAMDRAHRLGQTKQVTVYRLICKGTIEERILQRAKEKSEIQRMVISGGTFRPDILKPKEVVSLLLDDDEMEKKLILKQVEKKGKESDYKEKDRKRKRDKYAEMKKGTPGRKKKAEEYNATIQAQDMDSLLGESVSGAASPLSVVSTGSDVFSSLNVTNDDSNDALIIVDDAHSTFPPVVSSPTSSKRGTGRSRGRPKGSGLGKRPRGRGSVKKAISAAEIAGAQAGMKAAYAAYGYNFRGRGGANTRGGTAGAASTSRGAGKGAKPL